MNNWTLNIGEFGKIKNAEVELSPFMIFVGDNNSGKSYIMELLWGIISKAGDIVEKIEESPTYLELLNVDISHKEKISMEIQYKLINCFNDLFSKYSSEFVKKIFNHNIAINNISISRRDYLDLSFEIIKQNVTTVLQGDSEKEITEERKKVLIYDGEDIVISVIFRTEKSNNELLNAIYKRTLLYLIRKDYFENYSLPNSILNQIYEKKEPLYFPASRTGFMHTYRAILGNQRTNINLFDEIEVDKIVENNQIAGTNLTLPTILFLEKLQKLNISMDNSEIFEREIEFLVKNILKGTIQKNSMDYFEFKPLDASDSIPLHVTSSLVAELTPILIFLNSNINPKLWIIEEIESHLHPKIQLEIARFLVRLFNKDKCIWITTHSDSIVQKINNLITLSLKKNRKDLIEKLGFDTTDLFFDTNQIKSYQFDNIEGITFIKELPLTDYGFEVPSFNDTLDSLIIETANIQEMDGYKRD